MTHLSPEQLLDLAEGTGGRDQSAHLASCPDCERLLQDARSAVAAVSAAAGSAGSDVPEPSPLFWEHLSARVHDAVLRERAPRRCFAGWMPDFSSRWNLVAGAVSAAAAVAVIVVVGLTSRTTEPQAPTPVVSVAAADVVPVAEGTASVDDPAFGVVSDLAGDLDVETAMAAGLASAGSADHAVLHMTSAELMELERLLQEQAAGSRKS